MTTPEPTPGTTTAAGRFAADEVPAPLVDVDRPTLVASASRLDQATDEEGGGDAATRMAIVDGQVRRRTIVTVDKVAAADRTTIRRILPDRAAVHARVFLDGLGADCPDDDPEFPVGARVTYSLMLTADEAAELDAHDEVVHVRPAPLVGVI